MILPDNHLLQLTLQVTGTFHAEPFGALLDAEDYVTCHWALTDCRTDVQLGNLTYSVALREAPTHLLTRAWRSAADSLCVTHPVQPSLL